MRDITTYSFKDLIADNAAVRDIVNEHIDARERYIAEEMGILSGINSLIDLHAQGRDLLELVRQGIKIYDDFIVAADVRVGILILIAEKEGMPEPREKVRAYFEERCSYTELSSQFFKIIKNIGV